MSFWNKFLTPKTSIGTVTTLPIAPSKDYTFGPLVTDENTGLPELPHDLLWKVSRTLSGESVKISVVVSHNGEIYPSHSSDHYMVSTPSSEGLKFAAECVYGRIRDSQEAVVKAENLIGLYPPNSL